MRKEDLSEVLAAHKLWLNGEEGGVFANLRNANLANADLYKADLRKADLSGADLSDATLQLANLSEANMLGVRLCYADLVGADLSGANLSNANMYAADLNNANLTDTTLASANMVSANLRDAHILGADLCGADLMDADTSGVMRFVSVACGEDNVLVYPDRTVIGGVTHSTEELLPLADGEATLVLSENPETLSKSRSDLIKAAILYVSECPVYAGYCTSLSGEL